jgi:hypothetical protein
MDTIIYVSIMFIVLLVAFVVTLRTVIGLNKKYYSKNP